MPRQSSWMMIAGMCLMLGTFVSADETAPKAAADDTAYLLAYKYQADTSYRYETVHKVKFVSQFSNNVETTNNSTETRKAYRVVKVHEDGSATLELVIDWVKMKVDFGGGGVPVEFDSNDPGAKTQAQFAKVLKSVGKPQARLQCAPNGRIIKIEELGGAEPAGGAANVIQLKAMAGRDDFSFLTVFPSEPIKVGATWTVKSDVAVKTDGNLREKVQLQRVYTFSSVENDEATITFKTSVLTPVKNPNVAVQLIQHETSGKLVFDMARGAVVTRTVDTDKSVINPAGNNTAMHSTSTLLERIITDSAAISDIPANNAKQ